MLYDYIDTKVANVYGIYGNLGGGKSLTAVDLSIYFLGLGWTVTSNIYMFNLPKKCKNGKYTFVQDFENTDFWELPCGAPRGSPDSFRSVIVIDEVAEFFDQYSSGSQSAKRFLSWLRHSSKRGQFVFLIVQKPEFINKSLRLLIQKWVVCDDMYQTRIPVLKVRLPFCSQFVARRIFDKYGNLLSRGFNFANKNVIGRFYDTAQSIALEGRKFKYKKNSVQTDNSLYKFASILLVILILIFAILE